MRRTLTLTVVALALFAGDALTDSVDNGVRALEAGNPASALACFQKALESNSDDVTALLGKGLALVAQEQAEAALAPLERAKGLAPQDPNVLFALGKAYLACGRARQATSELERVKALDPSRANLGVFLGLAYLKAGKNGKALEDLAETEATSPDLNAVATLYAGVALARLGRHEDAAKALAAVEQIVPGSPVARAADHFKATVGQPLPGRAFRGSLRLGLQHDDNATQVPGTDQFGLHDQKHQTYGMLLDANFAYDLSRRADWLVTAEYDVFQTMNFSFHTTDLQDHTLALNSLYTAGQAAGMPCHLGLQLATDYLRVANSSFLQRTTVLPYAVLVEKPWTATTFLARSQWKNFLGQGTTVDGAAQDRDATNLFVGATQRVNLPRDMTLWLGYLHDDEAADGDDWDYRGRILHAGLRCPLPTRDMLLTTLVQFHRRDYRNTHTYAGHRRCDRELTLSVNLRCPLGERTGVFLEYLRDRNDSDIRLYSYSRDVYTVGLEHSF